MRLYKMELYKICSKKLFLFSAAAVVIIVLLYFNSFVVGAETTVNGHKYKGYQAIMIDRQITEEIKGTITDEKIEKIVEKYGFPSGVSEFSRTFLDKNYLNKFVMDRFSDGYFRTMEDYHVATRTYPVAESGLGLAGAATGKNVIIEYSYGWQIFTRTLETGCILCMFLTLFALSPVFSEESHANTRQILFTTKEGKTSDITAKIAAGLTITVAAFVMLAVMDFVLVWRVFGLDGLDCFYCVVMDDVLLEWNNYNNSSVMYMKEFLCHYMFFCFLGLMEAAAVALYFSAHCKSPFQSVIVSATGLFGPAALNIIGRDDFNGILFIASQMSNLILIGIAFRCFVPDDIFGKGIRSAIKAVLCIIPIGVGLFFRKRFPFFYTIPIVLIMEGGISDLGYIKLRYPWIDTEVLLFAVAAVVLFIMCSRRKYVQ